MGRWAVVSRHVLTILLSIPIGMAWSSGAAFAQNDRALQQRLARTTALNCTFSVMVTGDWKGGTPNGEVTIAKIKVTFTKVNADEGTAEADSTFGASFIVVRYASNYLHLMQMHDTGPLYTTTVLAKETKDGRFMAVHTRHEYTDVRLPGFTSRPEMYLGECAVTP